ncbi:hypothetical protein AB1K91_15550 [Terribacillus sp. 179-K 1B1 HS]|uniref:hypothetical protein n=1 Tax=Terribacillus sp. 179-K 1B1 HS TaxID=3142388 RepID=UPI00399FF6A6
MSNRAIDFNKTAMVPIVERLDNELSDHAVTTRYQGVFLRTGHNLKRRIPGARVVPNQGTYTRVTADVTSILEEAHEATYIYPRICPILGVAK